MTTITLTLPELMLAAHTGALRQVQNIKDGRDQRPAYGAGKDNAWSLHIEGAAGEMALAKYLNAYWSGSIGNLKAADVGPYQVRTTAHENGCLLLHNKDDDNAVFVLARGMAPTFELAGWIMGYDGKHSDHWQDKGTGRPCYFVPANALRGMESLPLP